MPEPDLATAERHEIAFSGGMMGMMGGGMMGGMMQGMRGGMMRGMQHSGIWAINGVAATGHVWIRFSPSTAVVPTSSRCTTTPLGITRCISTAMPFG